MELTHPKILSFCKEHRWFDVEEILLFHINTFEKNIQNKDNISEDKAQSMFQSILDELRYNKEGIKSVISDACEVTAEQLSKVVNNSLQNTTEKVLTVQKTCSDALQGCIDSKLYQFSALKDSIDRLNDNNKEAISTKVNDVLVSFKNLLLEALQNTKEDYKISEGIAVLLNRVDKIADSQGECIDVIRDTKKHLERFKNPSVRGRETELQLKENLEKSFPQHEVQSVLSKDQIGRMDLNLVRDGYPTILIDSKDYKSNVPKSEVEKFERDVNLSKNHGILIAPFSGIYNKRNFQIDTISGKVVVYLSNVGLDSDDIVNAVNVIYYLHHILNKSESESVVNLSSTELALINQSINEKMNSLKEVKNHMAMALQNLNQINFNDISQIVGLQTKNNVDILTCQYCKNVYKNMGGLKSHEKSCKSKTTSHI